MLWLATENAQFVKLIPELGTISTQCARVYHSLVVPFQNIVTYGYILGMRASYLLAYYEYERAQTLRNSSWEQCTSNGGTQAAAPWC